MRDADAAAHTQLIVDLSMAVHMDSPELAVLGAVATADTQVFIDRRHIPRRSQHGRAALVGLDRPTTARAAVAYGVEAAQHCVFKEGVVGMTAFVLGF